MSSKGASVVFACDVGSVSVNLDAVGLMTDWVWWTGGR